MAVPEDQEDLHYSLDKVDQGRGSNSKVELVEAVVGHHCRRRPKACSTRTSIRGSCSSSTLAGALQPSTAVP